MKDRVSAKIGRVLGVVAAGAALIAFGAGRADASTAFGDLNNFDVFNDTGQNCHGFEIELDDVHSTDITYTFDWNHYSTPTITEDNADPLHPKVFVRYAAKYDSGTGNFSAFTAVPATTPSPTNGHMCTDPTVNFGCEHFGVGYYGTPSVVKYNWLIENPAAPGTLIHGPAVNVATPSWTYFPPAPAQPVAQVQAVILAPPPPPAPVYEFGDATWVKSIVTTTHNNALVELKDLVSDDPNDPNDKNWANGEPAEVEVEWQILQTEFNNPAGANNELAGANEDLPNGDEVVTRRYEFYKYAGPFDTETNEALCSKYPQIADPADPSYKAECDPASVDILGDYIGAQMAGFNVGAVLGLIDHVQDGAIDEPYTSRTLVIGGNTPYVTSVTVGALPAGLTIDSVTGVLSGTPTAAGDFSFTVAATDADLAQASKAYTMKIEGPVVVDNCPDDPAKTEPGLCGCGVADTDSDADGTPDCNDLCPADPAKVAPGVCGCGVADVDSNGNGVMDCVETQHADLAMTLTADRSQASIGNKVKLTMTVRNGGPNTADAVSETLTCSGAAYHVARESKGCVTNGDTTTCSESPRGLRAGRTASSDVVVVLDGAGALHCEATASSTTLDPDTSNQSSSRDVTVAALARRR